MERMVGRSSRYLYHIVEELERRKMPTELALAAKLANMPLDEFKALNPSFNRPVILGAANPQILLPFENAERFQYNLNSYRGGLSSWTAVTVDNRERVESLAARLNVDVDTLREINRIPKGMRLKAGSTVMIPRTERHDQDISASLVDTAMLAVEPDVPDAKRVVVRAGRKDTVSTVARRYGVSVRQVQSWNKLSGSKLVAGQSLVLMLRPNSPAAMRAERGEREEDETPAKGAAHGKSGGKAQAVAKSEKSEKIEKSSRDGKGTKAEPRKRVVVEATPHSTAGKSTGKAAATPKSATRESKSPPTPTTKTKANAAR
jgi:membrane-bound lytic murein transglycosylase D